MRACLNINNVRFHSMSMCMHDVARLLTRAAFALTCWMDNAKHFNNEELPNSQSDSDDDEEWLPMCDEDDDGWHID